jgi:hypothetical protein
VDFVQERLEEQMALSKICEEICDRVSSTPGPSDGLGPILDVVSRSSSCCVLLLQCMDKEMDEDSDGRGSDNMTVVIVCWGPGGKRKGSFTGRSSDAEESGPARKALKSGASDED